MFYDYIERKNIKLEMFFFKDIELVTHGFNRSIPAIPPTNAPFEVAQKELWRKYIAWEKSNPLKADDRSLVVKRGY